MEANSMQDQGKTSESAKQTAPEEIMQKPISKIAQENDKGDANNVKSSSEDDSQEVRVSYQAPPKKCSIHDSSSDNEEDSQDSREFIKNLKKYGLNSMDPFIIDAYLSYYSRLTNQQNWIIMIIIV